MVEKYLYSFIVVMDPLRASRYRWTVCEDSQIHVRSPCSYATRLEAEKETARAVSWRVDHWRNIGSGRQSLLRNAHDKTGPSLTVRAWPERRQRGDAG